MLSTGETGKRASFQGMKGKTLSWSRLARRVLSARVLPEANVLRLEKNEHFWGFFCDSERVKQTSLRIGFVARSRHLLLRNPTQNHSSCRALLNEDCPMGLHTSVGVPYVAGAG